MNDVILVAGMPACGKTSFGDFLRDKKYFLHVDLEAFEGSYLHRIWEASLRVQQLELFVETLKQKASRIVLTWGFDPGNLDIVRALNTAGVELWWFDADEEAARKSFLARGTLPIEYFEAQLSRIREAWADMESCFRPHVIQTLPATGEFLTYEEVFKIMTSGSRQ
jgi:hypothetical protein